MRTAMYSLVDALLPWAAAISAAADVVLHTTWNLNQEQAGPDCVEQRHRHAISPCNPHDGCDSCYQLPASGANARHTCTASRSLVLRAPIPFCTSAWPCSASLAKRWRLLPLSVCGPLAASTPSAALQSRLCNSVSRRSSSASARAALSSQYLGRVSAHQICSGANTAAGCEGP